MGQRFEGDIVFGNDSSIFFEKADGTLKEFVRMGSDDSLTLINESSASVTLLPSVTNTYDIGSSSYKYKDLYLAGNELVGGTLGVTGTSTLGAATVIGTTNVNATGSAVTTIGTGGTGAVNVGNATGKTAVTGDLTVSSGLLIVGTAGKGLQIKEGSNAKMGQATLSSGTVTVSTTAVTANSRIFLTRQDLNGSTAVANLTIANIVASTGFDITSVRDGSLAAETGDTSIVNWFIVEAA